MPRQMHHLKRSITQVDDISILELARRRGSPNLVVIGSPARIRNRIHQEVSRSGSLQVLSEGRGKSTGANRMELAVGVHSRGFDPLHQTTIELVETPHMVIVDMCRD